MKPAADRKTESWFRCAAEGQGPFHLGLNADCQAHAGTSKAAVGAKDVLGTSVGFVDQVQKQPPWSEFILIRTTHLDESLEFSNLFTSSSPWYQKLAVICSPAQSEQWSRRRTSIPE